MTSCRHTAGRFADEGGSSRHNGLDMSETSSIRIPPKGSHGTAMGSRNAGRIFKVTDKLMTWLYHRTGGKISMGFPVVLLTTKGAKSGRIRTTPLGGFPDGPKSWLIVASMGGAARHPAWFFNIAKNPSDVWLEVGK